MEACHCGFHVGKILWKRRLFHCHCLCLCHSVYFGFLLVLWKYLLACFCFTFHKYRATEKDMRKARRERERERGWERVREIEKNKTKNWVIKRETKRWWNERVSVLIIKVVNQSISWVSEGASAWVQEWWVRECEQMTKWMKECFLETQVNELMTEWIN